MARRALGNLAPHRIEAGDGDGFRGVVNDDVDASRLLEGMDVAPVAPDDASFHLIRRQGNDRGGHLGDMLGGDALDGGGDDLACLAVALFPGFRLDLADDARHIVARVFFNLCQQDAARFFQAQFRYPLQFLDLLLVQLIDLICPFVHQALALVQSLFAFLQSICAQVELFSPLL